MFGFSVLDPSKLISVRQDEIGATEEIFRTLSDAIVRPA